jgi:YVTN family beta-propeller protein
VKLIVALLLLGCVVSFSSGQWVEKVIPIPDSLSGLDGVGAIQFHAPNNALYVGGNRLIVLDAATREKRARISLPGSIDIMCSSPASNKLYCASRGEKSIYSVDCAANRYLRAARLASSPRDMCYAAAVNKVYVACPDSNLVGVVDCTTDSLVATIRSLNGVRAICYNSDLNRVYAALSSSDEVAVLDCASDTLVRTIWVRGVEPADVCYDSISNCVYTANYTSATSSVIDCTSDSVVRIVAVGDDPWSLLAGPQGKIFCGGDGPSMTVIDGSQTRTISVGLLWRWSYDPANRKIYHGSWGSGHVTVVDAVGDSVLGSIEVDESTGGFCYDPVGNGTWWGGGDGVAVSMIDGATDQMTAFVPVGSFHPGVLRYNPQSNHLYCVARVWGSYASHDFLMVIDGDSGRVLKMVATRDASDSMLLNPVNNKVYFSNPGYNAISIVDCTSDSLVATIDSRGQYPHIMCYSGDGKVYVVNEWEGITVIDPTGDSVRTVVPVGHNPWTVCCDYADNKVYVGMWNGDPVRVIDASVDSVVATVAVGFPYQSVSWDARHNKVYVSSFDDSHVAVIDCAADTVLKTVTTSSSGLSRAYCDSVNDKVYFADAGITSLRILNPLTDSFYKTLNVGGAGVMVDNGRSGAAHRLYSAGYPSNTVAVVDGVSDSLLRSIPTGSEPYGLAWNPVHSWVYASNSSAMSITVLRDTFIPGIEENRTRVSGLEPRPTVVRGVLDLGVGGRQNAEYRAELLDAAGRKVLDLHPGANDVRALAPGVYFVREAQAQAQAVRRVVITK